MARTVTLGTLVSRAASRADKENDGHVSNDWKPLISEIYGQLHSLVTRHGARCFETEVNITATGASSYALPSDHLSTVSVDLQLDSAGQRRRLSKIEVAGRDAWIGTVGEAFAYELVGSNIVLYPKPSSGTYIHAYIPQPTDLSAAADGTNVDVLTNDGERFILWGVASIAKHKSDDDQRRAMLEFEKAERALILWSLERAAQFDPGRQVVRDELGGEVPDAGDWRWRYGG